MATPAVLPRRSLHGRRSSAAVALLLLLLLAAGAGTAPSASAHPLSTTAVLLDVGPDDVTGTLQLPIDRLSIAVEDPTLTARTAVEDDVMDRLRDYVQAHTSATGRDTGPWSTVVGGGRVEQVDGVDHLVLDLTLTPPTGTSGATDDFDLSYDAILERLLSHQVLVSARAAGTQDYVTVGVLNWQSHDLGVTGFAPDAPAAGTTAPQEATSFWTAAHLGVEHISQGADHLLFLAMLLLPAPLLARRGRWVRRDDLRRAGWRVVHVVTAFAFGHSITLLLAALGLIHVDSAVVESLIAVSVLASAVHAIRPLVPGGEAAIAVGFGLVHGLAFAALVDQLGLGRGSLLVGLLGFNLGIEVTQLLVVALLMPSLLLLSRTRVYPAARITVAAAGAVLSLGWLARRTGLVTTDPLERATETTLDHALLVAAALAAVAVVCWFTPGLRAPATGALDTRGHEDAPSSPTHA